MDDHDHRSIGNRLDLFHQQDDGPGVVFWHPRGMALYRVLEDYIRKRMRGLGYREVRSPQLLSRSLWDQSGHWPMFGPNMFAFADGAQTLALKPMSCPGHIQIFNKRVRSHRDLPFRICEFGACHRHEPSGALQGLMRTRAFTQDDAHVFCERRQVIDEIVRFSALLKSVYADFGFDRFEVRLSTRPASRAGRDDDWDWAEGTLADAARIAGLRPELQPGEGAFYGPKLEFSLGDSRGRRWQCGTVQVDTVLPERLDAHYVDARNEHVLPVLIHHAVFGSLERFIAILLEHTGGQLPFWLAPDQITVAPVGAEHRGYAQRIADALGAADLRVVVDDRPETLSRRVVESHELGIPCFVTVGEREMAAESLAVRVRGGRTEVVTMVEAVRRFRSEARL
ncbi:MAG: threonine--tRNA ligase [Alphaproteobacteria bacterium]|nr:threonine--tRNA ligase [Alphaproteobacteria bacterium]